MNASIVTLLLATKHKVRGSFSLGPLKTRRLLLQKGHVVLAIDNHVHLIYLWTSIETHIWGI